MNDQERIYNEEANAYDALITAEDCDQLLHNTLQRRFPVDGLHVLDIGAGTGRLTRWFADSAAHITLVDRAPAMLDAARRHLTSHDHLRFEVADARSLPLHDQSFDCAFAGWVFGHFRLWMPEGWRDDVHKALDELERVVRPNGPIVILETLGTGHTTPYVIPGLDEYFQALEDRGFHMSWVRTDYLFQDVETAAQTTGAFFGEDFAARVRKERWTRVPECTGIWAKTRSS